MWRESTRVMKAGVMVHMYCVNRMRNIMRQQKEDEGSEG